MDLRIAILLYKDYFMALNLLTYQALSLSSVGRATSESSAILAKSEK